MKAFDLLRQLEEMGIDVLTGVPDSTLKQFCDTIELYTGKLKHYVTANEGAAVGIAVGSYLASGKPACVYMQNSGIGNAVNPLVSLANEQVYGVPVLFLVGWRGEPGIKDEPQHVFQGQITCELFDTLKVPYAIIDSSTTGEQMKEILLRAETVMASNRQFAIIVKKGTFEPSDKFLWKNGNTMVREAVLGEILKNIPKNAVVVSTTGKISRELYEQSNRLFGKHDFLFMTVGGMGHASMIAFGIAAKRPDRKVICIDGDGAALMHMGAFPFLAANAPENFYHVVINNQAHESVGAMPTGCRQTDFTRLAEAAGYVGVKKIADMEELKAFGAKLLAQKGPVLYEIPVNLESRSDLGRPAESAGENKESFMRYLEADQT